MDSDAVGQYALRLIDSYFAGKTVPKSQLDLLVATLGDGRPELWKLIDGAWAAGNKARSAAGKPLLDPAVPLLYSRGMGQAEDQVRNYLPEEKILINQELFRSKIEGLDLASLDPAKERALIEELRAESFGLSREDTIIYFNLLKVDGLAKRSSGGAAGPGESLHEAAARMLALVMERFSLDADSIARLNGGKALDEAVALELIELAIKSGRIVPRLLAPYLGPSEKYFEKFKEFVAMVAEPRDGSMTELLQHFGLYLLLGGTPQDRLSALALSPNLESFISDRIGRMRKIFYVALVFGHSLSYMLFAQAYEINAKYRQMPEDQRAKLRKLYEAEDRLALLVGNAVNVATRRIADYGVESREIAMTLKKFLASNKRLVTAADLFGEARP